MTGGLEGRGTTAPVDSDSDSDVVERLSSLYVDTLPPANENDV